MEVHGIEHDETWMDGDSVNIRCDSLEEAFDLRRIALQHTACHIAPYLSKEKPVVVLPELNQ